MKTFWIALVLVVLGSVVTVGGSDVDYQTAEWVHDSISLSIPSIESRIWGDSCVVYDWRKIVVEIYAEKPCVDTVPKMIVVDGDTLEVLVLVKSRCRTLIGMVELPSGTDTTSLKYVVTEKPSPSWNWGDNTLEMIIDTLRIKAIVGDSIWLR